MVLTVSRRAESACGLPWPDWLRPPRWRRRSRVLIQLWDASDPRHPKIGAALPDNGTNAGGTWDASGNGLILVADPHDVRLWDVRNTGHPVLESTIMADPSGEMGFLGDQLAVVNVKTSPAQSELKLWDITNPRHPVAGGEIPNGNPESAILHISSRHVLTETDATGDVTDTTLWSVWNLRTPSILDGHASMDPDAVNTLNDSTWVALTPDKEAMDVLNVSDPRKPAVTAAIPVGTGYSNSGLYTTASPGGWLAGALFIPPSATGQQIHLMQVRADGKAISDYAQLPASAGSLFTFSPDGKFLATDFDTSQGNGFEAFDPQDPDNGSFLGILYPLDSDSLYQRLCSIATQTPPDPSWSKYLPATYYRSACS
jgi:hypothetical protein